MNIAILGMGKIGSGVYELIQKRSDMRVTRALDICVRAAFITTDICDIASDSSIDLVVETMGGIHPAYEYACQCIKAGKHFVSANKHMLSVYGLELLHLAKENNKSLMFSAACGGGIPYLRSISDFRKTDTITALGGILNGTTNYMLDLMQRESLEFDDVLSGAQKLGYAEKDPSGDIDGLDAERKLILACLTAFGQAPKENDIPTRGIRGISMLDIDFFKTQGVTARLIAEAVRKEGGISAVVEPRLFANDSIFSSIRENLNYAWYCGKSSGTFAFTGQGAGKYPTAGNIISDILAIKSGTSEMLPDGAAFSRCENIAPRKYYVRVRKGTRPELESLLVKKFETGDYLQGEALPIAPEKIFDMMNGADGFIAAYE